MVHPTKLLADVSYNLQGSTTIPTSGTQATTMAEKLISNVFGILTIIAVIYFILQIIFAGFGFLSSEGDEKKMEMNRSRLTNGVLGLFIVVVAIALASLLARLLGFGNILDLNQMFTNMGL